MSGHLHEDVQGLDVVAHGSLVDLGIDDHLVAAIRFPALLHDVVGRHVSFGVGDDLILYEQEVVHQGLALDLHADGRLDGVLKGVVERVVAIDACSCGLHCPGGRGGQGHQEQGGCENSALRIAFHGGASRLL